MVNIGVHEGVLKQVLTCSYGEGTFRKDSLAVSGHHSLPGKCPLIQKWCFQKISLHECIEFVLILFVVVK